MAPSLIEALTALAGTPYGPVLRRDMSLAVAQHRVAAIPLAHLRTLAGWVPPAGGVLTSALAGWWELRNIEALLARLDGAPAETPFDLGPLAVAWPLLRHARSAREVREALRRSPWGDPDSDDRARIVPYLRMRLASRICDIDAPAQRWAVARAAILVASLRFIEDWPPGAVAALLVPRDLGTQWREASTFEEFRRAAGAAAWVFEGITTVDELWRAEARWWRGIEVDGAAAVRSRSPGGQTVIGAIGLLGVDAWRVKAALSAAARGGDSIEVFDAVA